MSAKQNTFTKILVILSDNITNAFPSPGNSQRFSTTNIKSCTFKTLSIVIQGIRVEFLVIFCDLLPLLLYTHTKYLYFIVYKLKLSKHQQALLNIQSIFCIYIYTLWWKNSIIFFSWKCIFGEETKEKLKLNFLSHAMEL